MAPTKQIQVDPREFRKTLGRFASGITVITTVHEGSTYGMTANAFVSVSMDPPLVLVSVDNRSNMRKILPHSKCYGVSILSDKQKELSKHFAGRRKESIEIPFVLRHDMPLLDGAMAHLVCQVVDEHPAGDHTLYIGHVEYLAYENGAPLVFYTGTYRNLEVQFWDDLYIW
jgi:flavin reductase (DIM6/NTAB) family NADH-FMN oxidoreductase RutF